MYLSTLVRILFQLFSVAFIIGTILILVKSIKNYVAIQEPDKSLSLDSPRHKVKNAPRGKFWVLVKSVVVFVLWFVFSLFLFAIQLGLSVGDRVGNEPLIEDYSDTFGIIGAHILWLLAGILLIYWLGKTPKAAKLP